MKSHNPPVQWNDSTNIKWTTEILGKGHSSPVVQGDKIFITSSWKIASNKQRLPVIILVSIFLVLLAYAFWQGKGPDRSPELKNVLTWMYLGILGFSIFHIIWQPAKIDPATSIMKFTLWFHSGTTVTLLILWPLLYYRQQKAKIIISLLIICWTMFLIMERPMPEYYRFSNFGYQVFPRMTLPVILSILVALYLLASNYIRMKITRKFFQHWTAIQKRGIIPVSFFLGFTGFLSYLALNIAKLLYWEFINSNQSMEGEFESIFNLSYSYPKYLPIINTGFLIFFLADNIGQAQRVKKIKLLYVAVPLLAIIAFLFSVFNKSAAKNDHGIFCVDRTNGQLLWHTKNLISEIPGMHQTNTAASPTPLIIGDRVIGYFGSAGLICSDFNGHVIWKNTDLPYTGIHGVGTSPIAYNNQVILFSGNAREPYIASISSDNGKINWRRNLTSWEGLHGEHRTPVIIHFKGKDYLIDWGGPGRKVINLFDPNSGKLHFKYPVEWKYTGVSTPTVVWDSTTLYFSDKGSIHALNIESMVNKKPKITWSLDLKNKGGEIASPMYFQDRIYIISEHAIATCVDAKAGTIIWQQRIRNGYYYASPVIAGKQVYFTSTSGFTTVVACKGQFKILSENKIEESVYSTPVIIENAVYIRSSNKLWGIQKIND